MLAYDYVHIVLMIIFCTWLNLTTIQLVCFFLDRKHLPFTEILTELAIAGIHKLKKFINFCRFVWPFIYTSFKRRTKIVYENSCKIKDWFNSVNLNQIYQRINFNISTVLNAFYCISNSNNQLLSRLKNNSTFKTNLKSKITFKYSALLIFKFGSYITMNLLLLNKFLTNTVVFIPVHLWSIQNIFLQKKNLSNYRNWITVPTLFVNSILGVYKNIRTILLPLVLSIFFFFILLDFFSVDFLRQLGVWAVFGFLAFWLFSSFNFFLKRYRFGKFTSSIQRFWKRTNTYFWVIEGFMFSLFFYYYLNSSAEPIYMYDESNLNQQFLPALTASYQSYLMLLFIFFYTLYLLLALPTLKSTQQIFHLGLMTLCYTYIYLLENYQVYYILTSFYENHWIYDAEQLLWSLEVEIPRIRTKQQYFLIALILKYWHFVFIYLSWLFVVMKTYEKRQISFILLGLSSQNVLILFFLNILFNAQWGKFLIKRFSETAYYWFFTASNEITTLNFIQELVITCLLYAHSEILKKILKKISLNNFMRYFLLLVS